MKKYGALLLAGTALSGCGTLPDVSYYYYPAKSVTAFSVTQTVSCTADKQHLAVVSAMQAPTTTYSANYDVAPEKFTTADLGNSDFSDVDMTVAFTDDGRLKGVNTTTTGQGETIVKSAIALGSAVVKLAAFAAPMALMVHEGKKAPAPANACQALINWVGADKSATLTYTTSANLDATDMNKEIPLTDADQSSVWVSDWQLYQAIHGDKMPKLSAKVASKNTVIHPDGYDAAKVRDVVPLTLQNVARIHLDIYSKQEDEKAHTVAAYDATIPANSFYTIAVPKTQTFGTRKFGLALTDGGVITSLQYANTNGTAGAIDSATAAVTAATPAAPTTP